MLDSRPCVCKPRVQGRLAAPCDPPDDEVPPGLPWRPLFATIAADRRARMPETAINAEALLPGGPYDLWRADEPARRVKDLAGAFAEQPRLPKMVRRREILDTIDRGVRDGLFVASLPRPDGSSRTWWPTPIDEAARGEPALEVVLPDAATLADLDPDVLSPGVLPGLWSGEAVTVAGVVDYFAGGRTVMAQREGYEEPVAVPACPAAAVAEAIGRRSLWLLNGPASFQGEPLPPALRRWRCGRPSTRTRSRRSTTCWRTSAPTCV